MVLRPKMKGLLVTGNSNPVTYVCNRERGGGSRPLPRAKLLGLARERGCSRQLTRDSSLEARRGEGKGKAAKWGKPGTGSLLS